MLGIFDLTFLWYWIVYIIIERRYYMSSAKKKKEIVSFPLSVFETADTKEDLEDWLLAQNPEFIKKMRKARKDDLRGMGKDWETLKKELCLK
jgi:hypothetical protein